MATKPALSTQKIIFLTAFVSAALIASLFIFHMRQNQPAILSSEVGTVYSAPRILKDFKLHNADQSITMRQFLGHWTLLFFGFTHCAEICPNTLQRLEKVYREIKPIYPNLQVVMISLDPERDNALKLQDYVHAFHPDFMGLTGSLAEIRKLQSQFGIYSAKEGQPNENYQITHTTSVNLLNPEGKWIGIFHYDAPPAQLATALRQAMG